MPVCVPRMNFYSVKYFLFRAVMKTYFCDYLRSFLFVFLPVKLPFPWMQAPGSPVISVTRDLTTTPESWQVLRYSLDSYLVSSALTFPPTLCLGDLVAFWRVETCRLTQMGTKRQQRTPVTWEQQQQNTCSAPPCSKCWCFVHGGQVTL